MLVIRGFSLDPQIQVGFAGQTVQTLNQYRNDEEKGLYSRRWNECAPKAPPIETLPDRTCAQSKKCTSGCNGNEYKRSATSDSVRARNSLERLTA